MTTQQLLKTIVVGGCLLLSLSGIAFGMDLVDQEITVRATANHLDSRPFLGQSGYPPVNYSALAQKALVKHLKRLFQDVASGVNNTDAENSASVEVTSANEDWHWGAETFDDDVQLTMTFNLSGEIYTKTIQMTVVGKKYTTGSINAVIASCTAIIGSLLDEGIGKAIDELTGDTQFQTFIALNATKVTNLYDGLVPVIATYRVTEEGSTIRKKPMAKASLVKMIGVGSQLQIIGKLPAGWLQVAKEGEAIGWIHEGSVQALSVQSQPTAASAPVKPSKPAPVPATVQQVPTVAAAPAAEIFPTKPVAVSFPRTKLNPDDIAVIIGNANYKATAKDIPDVVPAYADAEGMKRYAIQALGIKEENVIFIKDAKLVDFVATFGTDSNFKGKLFNWIRPGQTNVFVYYSGHGAPSSDGSSSYLVPVDAQGSLIDLSAYSLKTLYANLGKLPAKSVTVVLESCFSGSSQSGTVIKNASPVFQKALQEIIPPNLTVISAAGGSQIASWEQDKSSGLFTKHFLLGMAGAADKPPYGNGDGKVTAEELSRYLAETVSYSARRYYGREQTTQVVTAGK